ncbi:ATPase [Acidovorax sp. Root275]|uniref:ATP-binding protein n=1 Tax=Acidovorax sp. Root275 TaxID=1736508 RepID=UPI00070E7B49|nr:ATP-binding protein [Acidovorax sp. Root275]KRD55833.1 ATPase [Acidovorax sp. Root275]
MSNVNIRRAIENIRSSTTVYTPIVETVVNAIEAIEAKEEANGTVEIRVRRSPQSEVDDGESKILDVSVTDNGVGFTDENRNSFDTLYSDLKIKQGGKGFGRFTCLKYFDDLTVESCYFDEAFKKRTFSMGKGQEIIVNEKVVESETTTTGTTVTLTSEKSGSLPRKLSTMARGLVEILLPYFITNGYKCPTISLAEADGSESIILNQYLESAGAVIQELALAENNFSLQSNAGPQTFVVRVFKLLYPRNKISKVSLVAHKREVTETSLQSYVPEFADEFVENRDDVEEKRRNYILKAYVFSVYLDANVSLERGAFEFQKENDLNYGISQTDIEAKAAEVTKSAVADQVISRQEKKKQRIQSYVEDQAPWHKSLVRTLDVTAFPTNPSDAELEALLQKEKFKQEIKVRGEVTALLSSATASELSVNVAAVASKISESSKNDLVHYVALRKQVLDIFKRSLELDIEGKYSSETAVHDIIFPTKSDDLLTTYENHNLWILDERLTFTSYVASDLPLNGGVSERPDLLVFDRRIAFRVDNETSNPVIVFEFKKPNRDDFVNPSSKEDPIAQIVRYVNSIREGRYRTPLGRKINIEANTPFYGYVVCDLSAKVEKWLLTEKNFTPMPDKRGWFSWIGNINLYIEVLSWDKVLRDADMRNRVFFHKLGI